MWNSFNYVVKSLQILFESHLKSMIAVGNVIIVHLGVVTSFSIKCMWIILKFYLKRTRNNVMKVSEICDYIIVITEYMAKMWLQTITHQ